MDYRTKKEGPAPTGPSSNSNIHSDNSIHTDRGIRQDEAVKHLEALGFQAGDEINFRVLKGKEARNIRAVFPAIPWDELCRHNSLGFGVHFVVNSGGTKKAEISACRALFYEHDDLTIVEQVGLWARLGLPNPTVQVMSGNKSCHNYWAFKEQIGVDDWLALELDLLDFAKADRSCNPAKTMRLAGFINEKSGRVAELKSDSKIRYLPTHFRPTVPVVDRAVVANTASEMPLLALEAIPTTDKPIPTKWSQTEAWKGPIPYELTIECCLSSKSRELVLGVSQDRNQAMSGLSRDLIGVERALSRMGHKATDAKQSFLAACNRCTPPLGADEIKTIWESALASNPGASLTDNALEKCAKSEWWRAIKAARPPKKGKSRDPGAGVVGTDIPPYQPMPGEVKRTKLGTAIGEVRDAIGDRLAYNEFSKAAELDGTPLVFEAVEALLAVKFGVEAGASVTIDKAVVFVAQERPYHPIKSYLDKVMGLYPDQNDRLLDEACSLALGSEDPLHSLYLRKFLIGAVARITNPGCKLDTVYILKGKQGARKSSFFRVLAGEGAFDDSLGSVGDKDERLKLHQSWIIEWPELESVFKRRDTGATKAFLTCATDQIRPPYGRTSIAMDRPSVIVGTTNEDEFLGDSTGNRRFWVTPSDAIDLEWVVANRDRLWAAAAHALKAGESWWLGTDQETSSECAVTEFATTDPWEQTIEAFITGLPTVKTSDILWSALQIDIKDQTKATQMRVTSLLRKLGWERGSRKVDGIKYKLWTNPNPRTTPKIENSGSSNPF